MTGFWNWVTSDAAGFFTALLVLVGAVQLLLFLWQLWLIRESLDDTKVAAEAAKEAADATAAQAKVAQSTLETMQKTAIQQLRAYVFVANGKVTRGADNFLRAELALKNSGQTPAHDLMHIGSIEFVPPKPHFGGSKNGALQKLVIPASQETVLYLFSLVPFDLEDERAYSAGQLKLMVLGELAYTDAFDQKRNTKFSFEVGGDVWGSRGHLRPTETGNSYT